MLRDVHCYIAVSTTKLNELLNTTHDTVPDLGNLKGAVVTQEFHDPHGIVKGAGRSGSVRETGSGQTAQVQAVVAVAPQTSRWTVPPFPRKMPARPAAHPGLQSRCCRLFPHRSFRRAR